MPDMAGLKALAHPDRLRLLGLLRFDGPATATSLARRMGLNSGATSYHLRQLAQHGFIEEVEGMGNRRERWWQARHEMTRSDPAELEGEALEAGMAMVQALLSQHAALMQRALQEFPHLPVEWRRAANASDYVMALTAEEALALKEKLSALLWEAVRQSPAQGHEPDPGKRNFMVMLHSFPFSGA
jgi:DNA-binding transcriptional ArsR family regulator